MENLLIVFGGRSASASCSRSPTNCAQTGASPFRTPLYTIRMSYCRRDSSSKNHNRSSCHGTMSQSGALGVLSSLENETRKILSPNWNTLRIIYILLNLCFEISSRIISPISVQSSTEGNEYSIRGPKQSRFASRIPPAVHAESKFLLERLQGGTRGTAPQRIAFAAEITQSSQTTVDLRGIGGVERIAPPAWRWRIKVLRPP